MSPFRMGRPGDFAAESGRSAFASRVMRRLGFTEPRLADLTPTP